MAGGIDWFRWHHGSVTDPKFGLIAKRSDASRSTVLAVWACLLEFGGQNGAKVYVFDCAEVDALLGLEDGTSLRIVSEMAVRGLISNGAIANPRRYYPAPTMRPSGGLWAAIRAAVLARDKYTCQYCGAQGVAMECDHVVPVADGGGHDDGNLKTACRPCNRSKASKSLADWGGRK